MIRVYKDYMDTIGSRQAMYEVVIDAYDIKSILYPGSHVDITPSFLVGKVTYVDSFKGTQSFFKNFDQIKSFIASNKVYEEDVDLVYYHQDYQKPLAIEPVDMIISQYAGFVGQATKAYLKKGGILLCNDSHGDATLAYLDNDYRFIGVVDDKDQLMINGLDKYFTFARSRPIDKEKVLKTMKGPKYKVQPKSYVFIKA